MRATDPSVPQTPEPPPADLVAADPGRWATVLTDVWTASPDGVVLVEEDGPLGWVSPVAAERLGVAPGFQAAAAAEAAVHRARRRSVDHRTSVGDGWPDDPAEPGRHTWWFPDDAEVRVLTGTVDSGGSRWRIWTFVDVTQRRAAQRAVRAETERMRTVVDALNDPLVLMVAVRDGDGTIVDFELRDANLAFANYFGLPRHRVIGHTVTGMLRSRERPDLLHAYRDCVETGSPLTIDGLPYTHPVTGQPYWFDVRGARVDDGLWLSWHDVSEQHAHTNRVAAAESQQRAAVAESAALRSELDRLLTASNSFVARWTDDGTITRLSESVGPLLGIDPDEMLGRHWIQTLTVEQDARRMAG